MRPASPSSGWWCAAEARPCRCDERRQHPDFPGRWGLDLDPEPAGGLQQLHAPDGRCPAGRPGRGSRGRQHPLCRADRRGQGLLRGPRPQRSDRRRCAPTRGHCPRHLQHDGPENAGVGQAGHRRGQRRRGRGRIQHRARSRPLRGHGKCPVHPGLLQDWPDPRQRGHVDAAQVDWPAARHGPRLPRHPGGCCGSGCHGHDPPRLSRCRFC